ncbi:hypothetical protein AKG12_08510 [Agrobacterium sp. SUL3]|jgi:hypothetical protein|nr:hypothetical protein AKG12_08510 [Agrobacterium sp. SUL3]
MERKSTGNGTVSTTPDVCLRVCAPQSQALVNQLLTRKFHQQYGIFSHPIAIMTEKTYNKDEG